MRGKLTPNEVRNTIREACEAANYDPFKELIKLATEKSFMEIDGKAVEIHVLDADQRITVAKEICSYMAPKLKNVEVKGDIQNEITITVKNYAKPDPIASAKPLIPLPVLKEITNGD